MKFFVNEIWFLNWFRIHKYEEYRMSNLKDAEASNDLVLKSVSPFLRPFCTVKWVERFEIIPRKQTAH